MLLDKSQDDNKDQERQFNLIIQFIDKQQKAITGLYQKILLKYFIIIQSHWFLTVAFLAYLLKMINPKHLNEVINFACYQTEIKSRNSKFCPASISAEATFRWQNEIIFRSGYPVNQGNLNMLSTLLAQNQTIPKLRSNIESNSDVYLLLISVALVNLIISLVVILFLARSHRKSKKQCQLNEAKEKLLNGGEVEEYLRVDASIIQQVNIIND